MGCVKHVGYTCDLNSIIISGTFRKLDEYVKQALESEEKDPIDIFIEDYWKLFEKLKDEMGTSAGFQQWLPEYLIFKSIKNYLEERLKVKFKSEKLTENLRKFVVSKNNEVLELRHNAPIFPKEKGERMGIRPDIAIMLNGESLAIFEIKVCVVDDKVVRGICDSFNKILKRSQNSPLLYVALFSEKVAMKEGSIAKELKELRKTGTKFIVSSNFHSNVILKDDRVLLKEALDKIYKKLELHMRN